LPVSKKAISEAVNDSETKPADESEDECNLCDSESPERHPEKYIDDNEREMSDVKENVDELKH
jgi:hypothetical protein